VLEIGPGIGALTVELAARAGKVVAVELDRALLPLLADNLLKCPNAAVVAGDILKTDLRSLVSERFQGLKPVVCANHRIYHNARFNFAHRGALFEEIRLWAAGSWAPYLRAAGSGTTGLFSICEYYTVPEILSRFLRTVFTIPKSHFRRCAHDARKSPGQAPGTRRFSFDR
jgi:16S rRNA (adenine1518-N6/adenine1519-N6)-dimethyltransferase